MKTLSDNNLCELAHDLYDDLDDYGWSYKKAQRYNAALAELNRRGIKL